MSLYVDIEKQIGSFHLKVKLEAGDETVALLGGSGCGKSMTLRCIAGIDRPDRGRIVVDDTILFDSEKKIDLTPQKRRTGLLFQNYALFPQMTVRRNLMAGARREASREKREEQVAHYLREFGLEDLEGRLPSQLSGGQQQRVALARILVSAPNILLLDEPFSALDAHLRFQMEQEVRERIRAFGKTVVLVSHDRDEVFRLADKIAVMNEGTVDVFGTRREVFHDPRTVTGARLTGCKNISRLAVDPSDRRRAAAKDWGLPLSFSAPVPEDVTHVGIRMHDIYAADGPVQTQYFPGSGPKAAPERPSAPFTKDGFDSKAAEAVSPASAPETRERKQGPAPAPAARVLCRVISELEDPFSITVMLRPEGAPETSIPIGWTLSKSLWAQLRKPQIDMVFPEPAMLLLREKN
ncbi:MAG: ATP-binding cassette domain-containing protein [Lachnospiraceae bacterium]|nr:ATP-binding cassette domain-containing protein [Lachnospiraceae bacterium]